jgi:hypothetical protein
MTAAPASPSPRPRSPAQIEASRQNGARSRGPVTPEGKARASRNALKHGLAALHHLVLEDEAPSELEDLAAHLLDELGAESELEARLVRRIALAFWKGERAERLEVALFDAAPRKRPPTVGGRWVDADPLATFDLARFNALRAYQAQQGRELSRCLKELRQLRRDTLPGEANEGRAAEAEPQNEPKTPAEPRRRNEPDELAAVPATQLPTPPPPPAEAENEPKSPASAGLPLLQPRHPVPLPGPSAAELGQPAQGAWASRLDDLLWNRTGLAFQHGPEAEHWLAARREGERSASAAG